MAGGGQPVPIGPRTKKARFEGLYKIDSEAQIKRSNQNPIIQSLYNGLLQKEKNISCFIIVDPKKFSDGEAENML